MHILDRVASVIRSHKLINDNDHLIVAVSGGADSLALLHILDGIDLPLKLVALYIDHGLRPQEIPNEKKIIEDSCLLLGIPFICRTVHVHDLVAQGKHSLEEAARIVRYRALEQVRQECGAKLIAVGHTADDQAEEFFIRLIRGSSSRGLSGMKPKRDNIIRPLLYETKERLIDFLSERGVRWCLDSSNLDRRFLRNRVRLDLLPMLEEKFNPALRKTILQSMDMLSEEDNFLEEQTLENYTACISLSESSTTDPKCSELVVNCQRFLETHPAIRRRIVEKTCWQIGIRPTYEQICTLISFIENGKNGGELHLADGVRATMQANQLRFARPLPEGVIRGSKQLAASINQSIPGPGEYTITEAQKQLILEELSIPTCQPTIGNELRVDRDKLSFPLLLRSSLPGEKFTPCGGPGSKKISRYFNDRKIPAKARPTWPVLLSEDKVVALVGLQLDDEFRISGNTSKILSIQWKNLPR